MDKPQLRFFHVFISEKIPEGGHHRYNKTLGIVAATLQDAIAQAVTNYPECIVWSANHRGEVNHVIEYKLIDGLHNEDKAAWVAH